MSGQKLWFNKSKCNQVGALPRATAVGFLGKNVELGQEAAEAPEQRWTCPLWQQAGVTPTGSLASTRGREATGEKGEHTGSGVSQIEP